MDRWTQLRREKGKLNRWILSWAWMWEVERRGRGPLDLAIQLELEEEKLARWTRLEPGEEELER